MTMLAEIHSPPCSTPQALGTTVSYSLHRKATSLPGQKPSPIASVGNLMSSESQLPCELVPKFLKTRNAAVVSLLTGWDFMALPALRMRAASPDSQP